MHLFKSQWLQEQGHRPEAPGYSQRTFGPRYGRHAVAEQRCATHPLPRNDTIVIGDFHAGRETLREMARYDHAA